MFESIHSQPDEPDYGNKDSNLLFTGDGLNRENHILKT